MPFPHLASLARAPKDSSLWAERIGVMSFAYYFLAGFFNKPQTVTLQAVKPTTTVKNGIKSNSHNGISGIMQITTVNYKQVNKIFWEKQPEQRNKPIIASNKDLTQEWYQIAESLAKK
jgi:hypothetical protein